MTHDIISDVVGARRRIREAEDAALSSINMTSRQVLLLKYYHENPGSSQTSATIGIGMDRSTLADVTRRLADRRLIVRRRTRIDARKYSVDVTEYGAQRLDQARKILANAYNHLFRHMMRADAVSVVELLDRIGNDIVRDAPAKQRNDEHHHQRRVRT